MIRRLLRRFADPTVLEQLVDAQAELFTARAAIIRLEHERDELALSRFRAQSAAGTAINASHDMQRLVRVEKALRWDAERKAELFRARWQAADDQRAAAQAEADRYAAELTRRGHPLPAPADVT